MSKPKIRAYRRKHVKYSGKWSRRNRERSEAKKARVTRGFLVGCAVALAVCVAVFIVVALSIVDYADYHFDREADVAVVLSTQDVFNPDTIDSGSVAYAVELWDRRYVEYVFFLGGSEGEYSRAGGVARLYAMKHGVDHRKIVCDTTTPNIYANLRFAQKEGERLGVKTFLIVCDPYKSKRAVFVARSMGMKAFPAPLLVSKYQSKREKVEIIAQETWLYIVHIMQLWFESVAGS